MRRRSVGFASVVLAFCWWFGRETIKAWFFDKVIHMIESTGILAALVEYGPPVLLAGFGLWLLSGRSKKKNPIPQPNMRLEDVVKRITGNVRFPQSNEPESMPILHACEDLREKARLGVLTVFGGVDWRTTPPADYDRMTRERIPAEYWRDHQIDVIGFLGAGDGDHRGRTQDLAGTWGVETDYYGIWFEKEEIDSLWPPKRRLTWRTPLGWTSAP